MTKPNENGKGEAVFHEKTAVKVNLDTAGRGTKSALPAGFTVEKHR